VISRTIRFLPLAFVVFVAQCSEEFGGRSLDIRTWDAVYSTSNNRIYAVLASHSPMHARSLVEINPDNLAVERSLPLPEESDRIVATPDGRLLYVFGSRNPSRVYLVQVDSLAITGEYSPSHDGTGQVEPRRLYDLLPISGSPGTYIAAVHGGGGELPAAALFDGSVPRPGTLKNWGISSLLATGIEDLAYSYNTNWSVSRIRISEDGLEFDGDPILGAAWGFQRPLSVAGGLLYAANGTVYDVESKRGAGWFRSAEITYANAFGIDESANRIYFSVRSGHGNTYLAYDLKTFLPVSRLRVENAATVEFRMPGSARRLLVTSGGDLVVFDSELMSRMLFIPVAALPPFQEWSPSEIQAERLSPHMRRLPIPARYLTADRARGRLFASVQGRFPGGGNRLLAIDARSGAVEWSLFAGSEPGPPAVTTSGRHVYVPLLGQGAVRKFSTVEPGETSTVWLQAAGPLAFRSRDLVQAIQVFPLPQSEDSWAVTQAEAPEDPSALIGFDALAVYDGAERRPSLVTWPAVTISSGSLTLGGDRLLGLNSTDTGFLFSVNRITADGAFYESGILGMGTGFFESMTCDDSLCATSLGTVLDAGLAQRIARLHSLGHSVVDRAARRVYVVPFTPPNGLELQEFDIETARMLRRAVFPAKADVIGITQWAEGEFAVLTNGGGILLISAEALEPVPNPDPGPVVVQGAAARIPLAVKSIAFDPGRGLLYAAVDGRSKSYPNELLAIDPKTRKIVKSLPVGSDPGLLRMAADARRLYLGLLTGNAVARVDLEKWRRDAIYPVPGSPAILIPRPDHADSFLVALGPGPLLGQGSGIVAPQGLWLYRDGLRLPSAVVSTPEWAVAADSGSLVVRGSVFRMSDSGLDFDRPIENRFVRARALAASRGFVFGEGSIASLAEMKLKIQLDEFGQVLPDPATRRLYYLRREGIRVYDWETFQALGFLPHPFGFAVSGRPAEMTLCGHDCLAVLTEDSLHLFDLAGIHWLIPPIEKKVDKSVEGVIRIAVRAMALHYDSRRKRLYVATPPEEGPLGNSILALDPATGDSAGAFLAGAIPGSLAMNDDQSRLFVGLRGSRSIVEIDPDSHGMVNSFDLPQPNPDDDFWPAGLAVWPGTNNLLGVNAFDGSAVWCWRQMIFDPGGLMRPDFVGHTAFEAALGATAFFSRDGSRLQVMGGARGSNGRWSLPTSGNGLRYAPLMPSPIEPSVAVCGSEVITSTGTVYDRDTLAPKQSVSLPVAGVRFVFDSAVACDPARDRLYFLRVYMSDTAPRETALITLALSSREQLHSRLLPTREGWIGQMKAVGEAGVAYRISKERLDPEALRYPDQFSTAPDPPDDLFIVKTP
jgi:DNA-binding beta-propeller fold protein YncE